MTTELTSVKVTHVNVTLSVYLKTSAQKTLLCYTDINGD